MDFGDYDGDGHLDLIVTNFTSEGNALFRNLGDGSFSEVTRHSGIREDSFLKVGFGARFFDYDNDGDIDVLVTNNGSGLQLLRNDGGNRKNWLAWKSNGQAGFAKRPSTCEPTKS